MRAIQDLISDYCYANNRYPSNNEIALMYEEELGMDVLFPTTCCVCEGPVVGNEDWMPLGKDENVAHWKCWVAHEWEKINGSLETY